MGISLKSVLFTCARGRLRSRDLVDMRAAPSPTSASPVEPAAAADRQSRRRHRGGRRTPARPTTQARRRHPGRGAGDRPSSGRWGHAAKSDGVRRRRGAALRPPAAALPSLSPSPPRQREEGCLQSKTRRLHSEYIVVARRTGARGPAREQDAAPSLSSKTYFAPPITSNPNNRSSVLRAGAWR